MGKESLVLNRVNDRLIDFLVGGFAGAIVENCAGATPKRFFRGLEATGVALSSRNLLTNFLCFLAIEALANFVVNKEGSVWSYDELPFTVAHGINPLVTLMFALLGTGARHFLDRMSTEEKVGTTAILAALLLINSDSSLTDARS